MNPALLVMAKEPRPGRVKTRLCPPCTHDQAADLAAAALADTLAVVGETHAGRRVLVLDGTPGEWVPDGFEVLPQRGDGLAERLAAAFEDAGAPALLVGMDTPQLEPTALEDGLAALRDGFDAVLGASHDGGYWTIGLRRPDPRVFDDVPMSSTSTGRVQLARLESLGLRTMRLPALRDVDTIEDAADVAGRAPQTRFATAFRCLSALHAADHEQPVAEPAGRPRLELPYR